MRNELNDIELIENYLKNQLSPQEKLSFEMRLMGDMKLGLDTNAIINIYEAIDDIANKQIAKKVYAKRQFKKYLTISIAVLFVIIVVLWMSYFFMGNSINEPPIENKTEKIQINPCNLPTENAIDTCDDNNKDSVSKSNDTLVRPILNKVSNNKHSDTISLEEIEEEKYK